MLWTFNPDIRKRSWFQFLLISSLVLSTSASSAGNFPLCLYVASYNQGEDWSDGVESGLRDALADHCEIASFYMDTHRFKKIDEMRQAGLAAFELARDLQPDIIITSDDNAAKYLIVPYLLDVETPVVFAGINWTVREYNFPADRITGMVEVAPIKAMLAHTLNAPLPAASDARSRTQSQTQSQTQTQMQMHSRTQSPDRLLSGDARILFIGSDNLSERKMLVRVDTVARSFGTRVDSILVETFDAWLSGFKIAQSYDLVIIGNNAGISGWNDEAAEEHTRKHTRALSVTYNDWMLAYSVLGYTRIAEEQGEWAGLSAVAILNGLSVSDIPVVTNRKVETWVNMQLLSSSGLQLRPALVNRARKFN